MEAHIGLARVFEEGVEVEFEQFDFVFDVVAPFDGQVVQFDVDFVEVAYRRIVRGCFEFAACFVELREFVACI